MENLSCPTCGKIFQEKFILETHIGLAHDDNLFSEDPTLVDVDDVQNLDSVSSVFK